MSAKILWLWKTSANPWCNAGDEKEWKQFSDIEMEIIEDAFRSQKLKQIRLDTCIINIKYRVVLQHRDQEILRPIKRIRTACDDQQSFREQRFATPLELIADRSFRVDGGDGWSPFFDPLWENNRDRPLSEQVETAAYGIIVEGEKFGHLNEATWLAEKLLEVKHDDMIKINKRCLYLYTRECFLYKLLNESSRKNDTSKINTLGWFGYLLFPSHLEERFVHHRDPNMIFDGTVYRGVNLTEEQINSYKRVIGKRLLLEWLGFTSTSKNRQLAEIYGNTLFIIYTSGGNDALDISAISHFPQEEEVLLRVSRSFRVTDVKYDETAAKYNIYIELDRRF